MKTLRNEELAMINGGDNSAMVWGEQAASTGLNYATNSGANVLVMTEGTLLAAAGGWVWAVGNFVDGIANLF